MNDFAKGCHDRWPEDINFNKSSIDALSLSALFELAYLKHSVFSASQSQSTLIGWSTVSQDYKTPPFSYASLHRNQQASQAINRKRAFGKVEKARLNEQKC